MKSVIKIVLGIVILSSFEPGIAAVPIKSFAGNWESFISYSKGLEVTYNNQLFISLVNKNKGNIPVDAITKWQLLASIVAVGPQGPKGDTGSQGPKGDTGQQGPKGDAGGVSGLCTAPGGEANAGTLVVFQLMNDTRPTEYCSSKRVGRFLDMKDGTVIDRQTGLQWEKKTERNDPTDIHERSLYYSWSTTGSEFNGTAKTQFLDKLNDVTGGGSNCFAHHCDWALPTAEELSTINTVDGAGCIYLSGNAFCHNDIFGATALQSDSAYWTSTRYGGASNHIISIYFDPTLSNPVFGDKGLYPNGFRTIGHLSSLESAFVRAVRYGGP